MRKFLLAPLIALAFSTSACETMQVGQAPAPLAATTADEKALNYMWETFDFILYRVDDLRDAGKLVPGTPKAKQVQGYLVIIRNSLNAATSASRAGNTTSYEVALQEATNAAAAVKLLLK